MQAVFVVTFVSGHFLLGQHWLFSYRAHFLSFLLPSPASSQAGILLKAYKQSGHTSCVYMLNTVIDTGTNEVLGSASYQLDGDGMKTKRARDMDAAMSAAGSAIIGALKSANPRGQDTVTPGGSPDGGPWSIHEWRRMAKVLWGTFPKEPLMPPFFFSYASCGYKILCTFSRSISSCRTSVL